MNTRVNDQNRDRRQPETPNMPKPLAPANEIAIENRCIQAQPTPLDNKAVAHAVRVVGEPKDAEAKCESDNQ
jgi:hypothetical protein